MADLIKASKIAFASEFAFYLKAHNFHWNVEGPNFSEYHTLLGDIYEEVHASVDLFAENIRKLDAYAPGSFSAFAAMSVIAESNDQPDAMTMIAILAQDAVKMAELCSMVFRIAEEVGEHGYADFLAGRQDAYRKHAWMLRSTLK
jgi:starvation-inducible DNA-binding protein